MRRRLKTEKLLLDPKRVCSKESTLSDITASDSESIGDEESEEDDLDNGNSEGLFSDLGK